MNPICLILGHKNVIKDWYPTDPVVTLACDRCGKILDQRPNPGYTGRIIISFNQNPTIKKIKRIFSPSDPYGEENWDE